MSGEALEIIVARASNSRSWDRASATCQPSLSKKHSHVKKKIAETTTGCLRTNGTLDYAITHLTRPCNPSTWHDCQAKNRGLELAKQLANSIVLVLLNLYARKHSSAMCQAVAKTGSVLSSDLDGILLKGLRTITIASRWRRSLRLIRHNLAPLNRAIAARRLNNKAVLAQWNVCGCWECRAWASLTKKYMKLHRCCHTRRFATWRSFTRMRIQRRLKIVTTRKQKF